MWFRTLMTAHVARTFCWSFVPSNTTSCDASDAASDKAQPPPKTFPKTSTKNTTTRPPWRTSSEWRSHFHFLLDSIQPTSSGSSTSFAYPFAIFGPSPDIRVDEVGKLKFPLVQNGGTVEALKAVANKIPYRDLFGWGYRYKYNPKVPMLFRNAWDIDKSRVQIEDSLTKGDVEKICRELGYPCDSHRNIEAKFYKLSIVEPGGRPHFDIPHKWWNVHFASVLVRLPSQNTGGSLSVSNKGKTLSFDLSKGTDKVDRLKYLACYADCNLSIKPPDNGVCAYLIYHLVDKSSKESLTALDSVVIDRHVETKLQALASAWDSHSGSGDSGDDRESAVRLGYLLDHDYQKDAFSAPFLKGRDRIVYRTLLLAKSAETGKPLFDVHLVLLKGEYRFRACKALDELGESVLTLFERSSSRSQHASSIQGLWNYWSGHAPSGSLCKDADSGWLVDSSIPLRERDIPKDYFDHWGDFRVANPYHKAAIFISPARN